MSTPNTTQSCAARQPAIPAYCRNAEFETNTAYLWGVNEHTFEKDHPRDLTVNARLTLIIQLKNHHRQLDDSAINAITRAELTKLVEGHGNWRSGRRPSVMSLDDLELDGFEIGQRLSLTQWCVTGYFSGTDNSEPEPLGWHEYWSERGVR